MDSFYSDNELIELGLKSVGKNVKISRKASIYIPETISIGNDVRIDDFCCLVGGSKGIQIGSNVHIAFHCIIIGNGGVSIEDFAGLSSRCSIYSATDDYSGSTLTNPTVPSKYKAITEGEVRLGKHVIIGTNSTILPKVAIGEGCSVGANSLVIKDLEPWGIYVGSPVKKIKDRKKDLLDLERQYLNEKAKQ
ncbi:MAG: acyltransferase [Lutisporaceae bacterium]|mgnify:CR=1 FL=1|jgi:acetyltransferase-like isoleucine patch superfamily enzyme